MKLISATPSPFARKVRIGLVEKGIAFELLTEVPWNDDTSLPLHNPLEKLPVLLPDDGPPVYHSAHIMEWLERRYPAPPLLPADDDGILEHRRLEVIGDGICDAVVLCLFERRRPEAHQSEPWVSRQVRKMRGGLGDLARTIGSATYAVRDSFGLADIAAGAALGYLDIRWPEIDWRSDHPNLATYAEQLFARASFRGTMPSVQHIRDKVV